MEKVLIPTYIEKGETFFGARSNEDFLVRWQPHEKKKKREEVGREEKVGWKKEGLLSSRALGDTKRNALTHYKKKKEG